MPIYEYDCPNCGRFEYIQKVSDKALGTCPTCSENGKKVKVQKAVSAASFQLVGSGWYKTDYANGSSKAKSKGDSSESKPAESKESAPAAAPASGESKPSGKCGSGCGCH